MFTIDDVSFFICISYRTHSHIKYIKFQTKLLCRNSQTQVVKMGKCSFKAEPSDATVQLGRGYFHFSYAIGRGGFGKVWKVEYKKTKKIYAMKEM